MIPESLARDMEQTINQLREDKNETLDVLTKVMDAFESLMESTNWGQPSSPNPSKAYASSDRARYKQETIDKINKVPFDKVYDLLEKSNESHLSTA
jgi:hypothetical protein